MMRKVFIKLILLGASVLLMDFLLGKGLDYLQAHAKSGNTKRFDYIAHEMCADVVISGSSRCSLHYSPQVFEDSLGMTCYNTGQEGQGIIMQYVWFKLFTRRYTPKIIIYDVMPAFDYLNGEPNEKYLSLLRPFYHESPIDSIILSVDRTERLKMLSSCYRHNGHIFQLLKDFVTPYKEDVLKGYRPVDKEMEYDYSTPPEKASETGLDSLRASYMNRFAQECTNKGIKLIFCSSPYYKAPSYYAANFDFIRDLSKQYDIPFIYHGNDSSYIYDKRLFHNASHMNRKGAEKYSSQIAHEIKAFLDRH